MPLSTEFFLVEFMETATAVVVAATTATYRQSRDQSLILRLPTIIITTMEPELMAHQQIQQHRWRVAQALRHQLQAKQQPALWTPKLLSHQTQHWGRHPRILRTLIGFKALLDLSLLMPIWRNCLRICSARRKTMPCRWLLWIFKDKR